MNQKIPDWAKPAPLLPERERVYRLLEGIVEHHRSMTDRLLDHVCPRPQSPQYGMPMDTSGAPNGGIREPYAFDATNTAGDIISESDQMFGDGAHFVTESIVSGGRDRGFNISAPLEAQFLKFARGPIGLETDDEGRPTNCSLEKTQIDVSEFPLPMLNFMMSSIPKGEWLNFCLKLCPGHICYGMDYRLSSDQLEMINQKLIRAIELRFSSEPNPPNPPEPPAAINQ